MSQIKIRTAIPYDAPALTAIIDAAYQVYRDQGIDLPPVSEGIADDILHHHVFVAMRHDGQKPDALLGGLVLIFTDDYAKLANVAVHPDAKGLGVGRKLMATCEDAARNAGHKSLTLATHIDMPDNVALYQHLGWVETGRDGNKVFMDKMLS